MQAWQSCRPCHCSQACPEVPTTVTSHCCRGRPQEFSPKARLLNLLGYRLPFDRHDWVVDRCGREVRYIFDFYFHEQKAGTPEVRGCCWGRVGVGVDMY